MFTGNLIFFILLDEPDELIKRINARSRWRLEWSEILKGTKEKQETRRKKGFMDLKVSWDKFWWWRKVVLETVRFGYCELIEGF